MHEKAIEHLKSECRECAVGRALHVLMDSFAKPETVAEPIKPKPTRSKPTKPAATKPDANRTEKPCNKCHVTKPLAEYPLVKNSLDGHGGTCRKCLAEKARAVYKRETQARKQTSSPVPDSAKPHACKICGKNFREFYSLQEHKKLAHP